MKRALAAVLLSARKSIMKRDSFQMSRGVLDMYSLFMYEGLNERGHVVHAE